MTTARGGELSRGALVALVVGSMVGAGIFSLPRSCRTSTERRALLEKLKVSSMPNQYWLRYRDLSDHIDKLAVLSGITREEREEIIRCVAALDGLVPRDQWYDFLQVSFPTFAWYLDGFSTGNEFVDGYFQDYCHGRS